MTQEEIIRMAREAFVARGFWPNEVMWRCWRDAWLAGASAEREALASEAERNGNTILAMQIRARGQK